MKALIAGGGIGGLTAALCLAAQGIKVEVLERAQAIGDIGAGIQLSPNASRVLHALGLEAALQAQAFWPQGTQFRDWQTGETLSERPLGQAARDRYGAPYYHIHRGDLIKVLERAAQASPLIRLRTATQVMAHTLDQTGAGVSLQVTSQGQKQTIRGDLMVGADGIHSVIRAELWGDSAPRFTGNVAWRALVPVERLPVGLVRPMSTAWWGPDKHFVHYYVRGGALVNCVCVVEKQGWEVESWTERGSLTELQADFAGWHDDLQQLIAQIDEAALYKWALFDRDPMPQWGRGVVTLLGDACHPTLPFMAQGAAMAIEDAAVLAGCLGATPDSGAAHQRADAANLAERLQRYEQLRRDRTASIQLGSRRNARTFHLSGIEAERRNRALREGPERPMDEIYGYDAFRASTHS